MVNLSDVFSQRRFDQSPCVALIPVNASIGVDPSTYENTPETKFLAYCDAWLALKEHRSWIHNLIKNISISLQTEDEQEYPAAPMHTDIDIVFAYIASNSTDAMISILAAADNSVRAQVALLNTRWTPSEMAAVLQTTGETTSRSCTVILYTNEHELQDKAIQTKVMLNHKVMLVQIPLLAQKYFVTNGKIELKEVQQSLSNEEIENQIQSVSACTAVDALLVFTSGTTSGSKGVRLSHRALWIQALSKLRHPCRYNRTTRMLSTTVPIFHVGGLNSTLALWLSGGTWMIPHDNTTQRQKSGFDANTLLQMISHPIMPTTTLVVVPAMLHAVLEQQRHRQDHIVYPRVDLLLIGGQSASRNMLDKLASIFPKARIVQTYACTEAASSLTFHEPTQDTVAQPPILGDCVGRPPPHVQLQLVEQQPPQQLVNDTATIITEPYKVGVFVTSGPHVMSGYWNRNDAPPVQQQDFSINSHVTNDLGFRDDHGRYYFCGRCNDVIRSGGETVLALEVERILLQHPRINECAVFGLPDERLGETVCAAIVMSSSEENLLSRDEIRRHCLECNLAGYKHPRRIFSMTELPRNASGKVLKFELVKMFQNQRSRL
ncbi:AMP-binding enzyme [Fragilaria crotonensis]|nr:AMP-binding enzyme [Fragilaria crotonensis]